MILTKEVTIKLVNKWLVAKYIQRGFENIKVDDEILVPLNILPIQRIKIDVKCDICGKERKIYYSTYMESTKNESEIYVCHGKCANVKREKTNMKLYGVKNCFQSESKKEKIKETYVKQYGVNHNMKLLKCLERRVETYRENYGCDNPSQSEQIKIKKMETCQKNYGVDYPFQSKTNLDKSYKTNYMKYGTKVGSQNLEIQEKIMNTQSKIEQFEDTDLVYQGSYELDFLNNFYGKFNIRRGLMIPYKYYNSFKVYYPDYYLPDYNLIVEIKSDYTYKKELDKNICKRKSCIEQGYDFIFIINKNYDEFIQYIG